MLRKRVMEMGMWEIFLIGVGLSMDAFAVAVCKGLHMRRIRPGDALLVAVFFGGFQALMPLLGWVLGRQFERYITEFEHWIAFGLLAIIGGKMVYESLKGGEEEPCDGTLKLRELFLLAVATSIDALAVGISFAFLQVPIFSSVAVIGATTFVLSLLGVWIGHRFGAKYKSRAELAGGAILILLGIKILLEHLGVL